MADCSTDAGAAIFTGDTATYSTGDVGSQYDSGGGYPGLNTASPSPAYTAASHLGYYATDPRPLALSGYAADVSAHDVTLPPFAWMQEKKVSKRRPFKDTDLTLTGQSFG